VGCAWECTWECVWERGGGFYEGVCESTCVGEGVGVGLRAGLCVSVEGRGGRDCSGNPRICTAASDIACILLQALM
jgi:hypothetical protein